MTATAIVNASALHHNLSVLRERCAPAELIFIVKANGYGHDSLRVASLAYESGIRFFGCLEIDLARSVREVVGDDARLLAWQFGECDDVTNLPDGLELGVGSIEQLELLERSHRQGQNPTPIHLKVDTGLNRNGVPQRQWVAFVTRVATLEAAGIVAAVGVWTHINEASDEADDRARTEFIEARQYAETTLGRTLFAHLAASSASFRRDDFRFDAIRVGGHAYGIPSFDGVTPREMGLRPVMTLTAPVTVTDNGQTFIEAGYRDGVPGYAAGLVSVSLEGRRYLVKSVEAERILIEAKDVSTGTVSYLFGEGLHGEQTVREWGDLMGTLGDEITCRISPRVPRVTVTD